MVYLLKCANDKSVNLQLELNDKFVEMKIDEDAGETQLNLYLSKNDLFELIGVLHHLQKQL